MKILIADDHTIVREGVKHIVKSLPEVSFIDEASDGAEAYAKISNFNYDMAIMDISMPKLSGLDILQRIKSRDIKINVLILSFYPQEQYAVRAFKLGAAGYLSKDSAFEELNLAIRRIAAGGKYVSSVLAEKLIFDNLENDGKFPHEILSDREFQVMVMLAKGQSIVEIAKEVFISEKTVSTYRSRILEKMRFKNNADLTIYALKNNLVE